MDTIDSFSICSVDGCKGFEIGREYLTNIVDLMSRICSTQEQKMEKAAVAIADSMAHNGLLHVFGTGHSHMLAEEVFYRAGGFANVNAILETGLMFNDGAAKSTALERVQGYASIILNDYDISAGDVIIIASNSGINPVPVEMAMEAKKRGLFTIAITSLQHSNSMDSRHPSNKKLYEVVDLYIDNCCGTGDASVAIKDLPYPVGPTSTVAGILILNSIMCQVAQRLVRKGIIPPIYVSSNINNGDRVDSELVKRFKGKIRHL
ncbi:MAG TPA: SIS domain-containing protein [Firmicutes bacterium]|nr:SIS domain-containing protein [Bacillota bacterium]